MILDKNEFQKCLEAIQDGSIRYKETGVLDTYNELQKEIERLKIGIDLAIYCLANEDISNPDVVEAIKSDCLVKLLKEEKSNPLLVD